MAEGEGGSALIGELYDKQIRKISDSKIEHWKRDKKSMLGAIGSDLDVF